MKKLSFEQRGLNTNLCALFFLLAALPLVGGACARGPSRQVIEASRPTTLTYWRVTDDEDAFADIVAAYKKLRPHVTIEYRKFRLEEYEREIMNALAEDRGPDIFSVHNTWVRGYEKKILPMPPELTLPFREQRGTVKKEIVTTLRKVPTISLRRLQNEFVDQVARDMVITTTNEAGQETTQIYGLPLAVDTLALFYNRDLLNAAGIAEPPATWEEFQKAVQKLTKFDAQNRITQSGAAIGAARNVDRAFDLLSLIMSQNGTQMADESGFAAFNRTPPERADRPMPPADEALVFYTDFAKATSPVYAWNEAFPNSLEAFATGRTAMFFGYSYHLPLVRARAPKLRFGVAPMPQLVPNGGEFYANYWVETVSRKTKAPNEAWDFIQFAAAAEQAQKYLAATKKPTALRALQAGQLEDIDIGVFASQVLTAKSWYRGRDARAAEEAFLQMIEDVRAGVPVRQAVEISVGKINQTIE